MKADRLVVALPVALMTLCCFSLEARRWGTWVDARAADVGAAEASVLDWSEWPDMIERIDGRALIGPALERYKKARLAPGAHAIEYSAHVHDFGHVTGQIDVELKAGHAYAFRFDTCFWCKPRRYAVWIDDKTTGEVAWGRRPDWPRWFL